MTDGVCVMTYRLFGRIVYHIFFFILYPLYLSLLSQTLENVCVNDVVNIHFECLLYCFHIKSYY